MIWDYRGSEFSTSVGDVTLYVWRVDGIINRWQWMACDGDDNPLFIGKVFITAWSARTAAERWFAERQSEVKQ